MWDILRNLQKPWAILSNFEKSWEILRILEKKKMKWMINNAASHLIQTHFARHLVLQSQKCIVGIYCFFPTKPYHHHQKWREKLRVWWTLLGLKNFSLVLSYCQLLSPIIPYCPLFSFDVPYYPIMSKILLYCPILSRIVLYYRRFSLIVPNSPLLSSILPYCPFFSLN